MRRGRKPTASAEVQDFLGEQIDTRRAWPGGGLCQVVLQDETKNRAPFR